MCFRSHKFQVLVVKIVLILLITGVCVSVGLKKENDRDVLTNSSQPIPRQIFALGDCKLVVNKACPDENVKFFLYNQQFPEFSQAIKVGDSLADSNLLETLFDPKQPVKIVIHGYNSDMTLGPLVEIRKQYLSKYNYNVFAVDWSILCPGPCYPTAVYNTRHVGKCMAQLVNRIREAGSEDIHVIGFSLGAHVANYLANNLRPYKLPRISGLDPAMPGFTFVTRENKLDAGDAEFVDVIHTNAFVQGKIEASGHVDFYMNGGVIQPGCWAESRFFACNHHRAPLYFAESITTDKGFWGWPCNNYVMYLLGMCPPKDPQIIAGEFANKTNKGMYLGITGSVSPFAVGKFTGPSIEVFKITSTQQRSHSMRKLMELNSNSAKIEEMESDILKVRNYANVLNNNVVIQL